MAIGVRNVGFSVTPSIDRTARLAITVGPDVPPEATVVGLLVGSTGDLPAEVSFDRAALRSAGFDATPGETLVLPVTDGQPRVLTGIGDPAELDPARLRDAAAAFALAAKSHSHVSIALPALDSVVPADAAQALVEGVLLARYRYDTLKRATGDPDVESIAIVVDSQRTGAATEGAQRGRLFAAATQFARDLANTPHSHLNASNLAELASELAPSKGLVVEVFDKEALAEMGCGGLLGVNAGSVEPPQMVKVTYRPTGTSGAAATPAAHLTLVGKALMYDSGGLSLKPGDEVHAQMKNDMSGGGAVLAAMSVLAELGCPTAVTGYLMCTDNMPSGTAMALGDVITIRGGTTVEVINTDAEGRLIMADALVLATEEPTDAIVDIATLTGACMRALGTQVAGVMGNDQGLIVQIEEAAQRVDEPVWQLPLDRRYRGELDSGVADLRNVGGANAGAITAALFLAEFVGSVPWAHIDIAGTANNTTATSWRTAGCTGFGARLLVEFATSFVAPTR